MKLKQRVAGADLVPALARLSASNGYRIFLLGSDEQSSAGAAAWMQRNFPNLCIAGRHCPKFQPLEEMDHEDILLRIEDAQPDILLVAFGNPKQEKWLAMLSQRSRRYSYGRRLTPSLLLHRLTATRFGWRDRSESPRCEGAAFT
jgi:N-acetylglucosaminyldiphosphoundecaprenol N-acetyl-beta-D-mannosaminyltransferase